MPNCKICGKPVVAANVFHSACWEHEANRVAEEFCDHYCRFPREALDEEILHEAHCDGCPSEGIGLDVMAWLQQPAEEVHNE